jgi:polar amino acid transport system substrate-binding protein
VNRSAATVSSLAMVLALIASACTGGASPTPAATAAPTEAATATEGASPTPSPVVPTSLITPGTVVDCVDIEYPPMEYFPSADVTDPAKAIGFDVDSAKAVVEHWGLKIEIRNTAFDALIPDLQAARCDIVWTALFVNATRLEVAEAVPYLATGHVVMVPAGNPKAIKTLDDLCGKSVSIQAGGLVEEEINKQSKACTDAGKAAIDIQGYQTVAEEFQQIVTGRVDAVWETDTAVADYMVKNPGKYEIAFVVSRTDAYGVYFQKNKADLAAALVDALKALKADGSWDTIATQYAQDPAALAPACPGSTATAGCHPVE